MINLILNIFHDAIRNPCGSYSSSKIGAMISLTIFLVAQVYAIIVHPHYFFEHEIDYAVVCISLTGGRKVLDSVYNKIQKKNGADV
ncbi:hypothetical protein EBU24_01100 [bacterium]|nr:hypothetical protein [bacterium]